MSGKPVAEWLLQGPETSLLVRLAARHLALQRTYEQIVSPSVATSSCVAASRGDTVQIVATNGAIAAKLKQLASRLTVQFRERGQEVTRIEVMVQVRFFAEPGPPPPKRARLPLQAVAAIEDLAANMADASLRSALDRFAKRHRG
ncbi:MAG: DciA family protein [Betaproteobacteria bacterium]